ncbi:MAG: 1,4-dihydroxy-2-naphthoate polyprenyltransferase [Rhodocyclales bacterium]|nr:1,4-dihydroxy-2-naphthoate polyprenyltransferase [Rhodocyclales bacterium]
MRPELPVAVTTAPPTGGRVWWTAARPRTLSISATPVLVGSALAWAEGAAQAWLPMLAALCGAILIQIGTNLHNDAADFERGTDRADRIGPLRVTAAGWASPRAVRRAAVISFALALLLGIYLVAWGGWPILVAGVASLIAGWSYSGGRHPVSHTPLGEIFVLAFFGLVAVAGSHWLQAGAWSSLAWLAGVVVGMPAAAVLLVNNYRDLEDDLRGGRRTLAAILGRERSRLVYAVLMLMPFIGLLLLAGQGMRGALLGFLALPFSLVLVRRLRRTQPGPQLNLLLAGTAQAGFALGALVSIGLLW